MNYNKMMSFFWFFIIGIVAATLISVNVSHVKIIYILSGIFLVIGFFIMLFQKKNFSISDKSYMTFLLIGSLLLGFGRYTQLRSFTSSNHISKFAASSWNDAVNYEIVGKILADPDVYYDKTRLTIEPYLIREVGTKKYTKVEGGNLMVQIKRLKFRSQVNELWAKYSVSEVYGDIIKIQGNLIKPRSATDPYGFSDRKLKNSENIYAVCYTPREIETLEPNFIQGIEKEIYKKHKDKYNPWYLLTKFSLNLKNKMLWVFKQTMPYPQSAFLGGVTLGLRRGLNNLPCYFNSFYKKYQESIKKEDPFIIKKFLRYYNAKTEKCNNLISEEFKWAGVNHVLAVSGLHVTIITIFLFALFSLMKVHQKLFAPLLVFALIVFTIITGARPSTVRAALMNSIGVLTMVYSKKGFRASALFAIASAAFLILIKNPLIIYSPSFTLSFGAVLSLVLITKPVDIILVRELRGLTFILSIITVIFLTLLAKYKWFILTNPYFFIPAIIIFILLHKYLKKLNITYPLIGDVGYHSIPNGIRQFVSAQFGIQFGMMIPLSAFYFGKYPLAGAFANFIAIPLIGIIVQLGMLAGLIGLIPKIGIWIALLLNATNSLLCILFLLVAHYSTVLLPYPHATSWTIDRLVIYYGILGLFIWWYAFIRKKEELYFKFNIPTIGPDGEKVKLLEKIAAGILIIVLILISAHKPSKGIDVTILPVGYSDAYVVQCHNGKNYLINGANRSVDKQNPFKLFDQGERSVFNYLKKQGIISLDGVFLQSLKAEYMTGLQVILEHADIKEFYDIFPPNKVSSKMDSKKFFELVGDSYYLKNRNKFYIKKIYDQYMVLLKIIEDKGIKHKQITAGQILIQDKIDGTRFQIKALYPIKDIKVSSYQDNCGVLKLNYGDRSILFAGTLLENGLKKFIRLNKDDAQADILIAPDHGVPLIRGLVNAKKTTISDIGESLMFYQKDLLKAVKPKIIVMSFEKPRIFFKRNWNTNILRFAENVSIPIYKKYTKQFYITQDDYAVIINLSNDNKIKIVTMKEILNKEMKKEKELKSKNDFNSTVKIKNDNNDKPEQQSDNIEDAQY